MSSDDGWKEVTGPIGGSHWKRWIGILVISVIILSAIGAYALSDNMGVVHAVATTVTTTVTSYATTTATVPSTITNYNTTTEYSTITQDQYITTTQYSTVSSTVTSVSTVTSSITQVPDTALVITNESYSNATKTMSMTVENTENYTLYAQFSATMNGDPCCDYSNPAGTYHSSVFQFNPLSTTDVLYNITDADYSGDCITYVTNTQLFLFVQGVSTYTQVSGTYTFEISPSFLNPDQTCP
jgi:hypothetical protein